MDNPTGDSHKGEKKKKALRLLTKLLKASKRAQAEGKQMALEKIISEANKLSNKLEKKKKVADYKSVHGEIVNEGPAVNPTVETEIIAEENALVKSKEEELVEETAQGMKAEHSNLAIIAAKKDFIN